MIKHKRRKKRIERVLIKKTQGYVDYKVVGVSQTQAITKFPQQETTRQRRRFRDQNSWIMMKWWLVLQLCAVDKRELIRVSLRS